MDLRNMLKSQSKLLEYAFKTLRSYLQNKDISHLILFGSQGDLQTFKVVVRNKSPL